MKVLIISTHRTPTLTTGGNGLGRLAASLAIFIKKQGCQVDMFASKYSKIPDIEIFNYYNDFDSNIVNTINKKKYDLIIDFTHLKMLSKFNSHRKYPIINYIVDEECNYNPKNCVVTNSFQKQTYKNSVVYPIGVDTEFFKPQSEKGDYFSFAGKIEKRKGYDLAIEICRLASQKLILAGGIMPWEPDAREALNGQEWIGEIKDNKKYNEFVGKSKCLLYPSRREAGGMGILEAMSMGTPVITIAGTGTSCFVKHGTTGFIASSVKEAASYCKEIDSLDSNVIRNYCVQNFDQNTNFHKILELGKEVANGKTW